MKMTRKQTKQMDVAVQNVHKAYGIHKPVKKSFFSKFNCNTIAKVIAFVALFVLASYGCRQLLIDLPQAASIGITAIFVLLLAHAVFEK
jgi:hypothetical protein